MRTFAGLITVILCSSAALADGHQYLAFDDQDQLVVSGPFSVVIPVPGDARIGGPVHDAERMMDETLQTSIAGYFADDQFLVIEIETTDAPSGTIDYGTLPTIEMAGRTFHTRNFCYAVTQEEIDAGEQEPIVAFIAEQNFVVVPAVYVRQLFVTNDDGTAEGVILYGRRVASCDAVTDDFKSEFDQRFESFVASVRQANN